MSKGLFLTFVLALSLSACDQQIAEDPGLIEMLKKDYELPVIEYPEDNEYSLERSALGKALFFDKALSKNNDVSCASCHHPEYAFSDNKSFSKGTAGALGNSNSPSLSNIAYHPYYTRAGGVPSLEMQVLVPIQEHNELNTNIVDLAEKLKTNSSYQEAAREAYDRELDPYVIVRALANFERSLLSNNSPYDAFLQRNQEASLSDQEKEGLNLFYSDRTNCSTCHSGFNFTDYTFQNNGLYVDYQDSGRMRLTKLEEDRALFKVPSLRNVWLTAPYMHDGSIPDLASVVEHYNSGGAAHKHKSELIRPLNLSDAEKRSLISFLTTLTDQSFVENPTFKPEV